MPTVTEERPPQALAEELSGLTTHVDWPAVWAGPPNPGQALDDWCALFGWRPLTVERVLRVRTSTGADLTLEPLVSGGWSPVRSVTFTVRHLNADTQDENDLVLDRTAEVWPAYEAAAREVLGAPEFSGAWDDPAFPEPPDDRHWLPSRDFRLGRRDPYRMAVWSAKDPEGPVTVLTVKSGGVTRRGVGKRGVMINVHCYPQDSL
ncbi:hypothetical protein [Streptomyces sp. NPDC053542]|uniref:hypothetical protein n=1 Tax=Streptomyces sp. NPDC053542 TaxID=3365710 RepID=UPI0037CE88DF